MSETDVILAAARLLVKFKTVEQALQALQETDISEETKLETAFWMGLLHTTSMYEMNTNRFDELRKVTQYVAAILALEEE